MEMTGEQLIPASQAETWAALNDPDTLKACVPGCESLEKVSETEYRALMTARVGPVSAKFKGKLSLADLDPPNSYSLSFDGQGGVAGFGKGSAQVRLAPEGDGTRLSYAVKASVGGKLAQIGSRLVDAAAKKIAAEFFRAFSAAVATRGAAHADAAPGHDTEAPEAHEPGPVPRDPDLPTVSDATLGFVAAGALVVTAVSLLALLH